MHASSRFDRPRSGHCLVIALGQRFRGLCVLLVFALWAWSSLAREAEGLQTVPINGERFVSLQKWAKQKGFSFQWNQQDKSVALTNRWARLEFNVNSRKAAINGTTVWLSSSLPAERGTVFIGERDLATLIDPILYPPKGGVRTRIRTIAIAAGHGGRDPGFQLDDRQEKKYALLMSQALAEALKNAGFNVLMVRDADVYVEREEQAAKANRAKADLFITVHYNAAAEVEAKGFETYCLTPAGATPTNAGREKSQRSPGNKNDALNALLAYHVHKAVLQDLDMHDRGLRRAGFVVLREITMPGILIEGGFMSNPFEAARIYDPKHRRKMAAAIADGVLAYKRLVERK